MQPGDAQPRQGASSNALVFRSGTPPAHLLQSVASGALGPDAFTGGTTTAALGLGFHA